MGYRSPDGIAGTVINLNQGNVKSVMHCATRLRFTLNDATLANTEKISNLKGVLKVVNGGGQYQIVIGTDVPQVYQEVFSSLTMGNGIAINPVKGEIKAPVDGVITTFFHTGHAIGIQGDNGAEILIHVGMDTVSLNGEGFEPLVREGDRVKKGQLLLKFDMDVIKAHNLSVVTPVVVTNTDDLKAVNPISSGSVTEKDAIIRFEV